MICSCWRAPLIVLALVVIPLAPAGLPGQIAGSKLTSLSIDKGLSFNRVNSILQDSRGLLWFGTGDGLNRYDGYSFSVYRLDPADSSSISSNNINSIYEDRHGGLWIDASSELNRYDRFREAFTRCLRGTSLASMCEDTSAAAGSDAMWFATYGAGLYQYRMTTQTFRQYRHETNTLNSLSSDSLMSIFVDRTGVLWIGTSHGLNSLDAQRLHFTRYPEGPSGHVHKIIEDPDFTHPVLWIGADDGLYLYDVSSGTFSHFPNRFGRPGRPRDNVVLNLYCDTKARFWVFMRGGMARFDRSTGQFAHFEVSDELFAPNPVNDGSRFFEDRTGSVWVVMPWQFQGSFDPSQERWVSPFRSGPDYIWILSMLEDRTGTRWFGTMGGGLRKLDNAEKQFEYYTYQPGDSTSLASPNVLSLWEDTEGCAWAGTTDGLDRLDAETGTFTHYHPGRGESAGLNDVVRGIAGDHNGNLWVGTGYGLDEFDRRGNRFIHHVHEEGKSSSLTSSWVEILSRDSRGRLWAVTGAGVLEEYDRGSNAFLHHYPPYRKTATHGLPYALLQDREGVFWLGVDGGGLNSYDPNTGDFEQYVHDPEPASGAASLGQNDVTSILEDHTGVLWIGTHAGLDRFDRRSHTFSHVTVRDGLASDRIGGMLEDAHGRLWLGTARGISRYDPRTGAVRNFDAGDGVRFEHCENAHRGGTGFMYFGGYNGFVRFHPDSIRDNSHIPPVIISEFRKFDKITRPDTAIIEKKSLELSYRENVFSFGFSALNFTHPEKNEYAYKLEGFDRDWVYCGTRRTASYTNLDGGTYVFRVKGSNNDGVWNDTGASIQVIIIPPFWSTWWFRMLLIASVILSAGWTARTVERGKLKKTIERLERERALARERARISQDMHDEVGANLTKIVIISELAMKTGGESEGVTAQLQNISQTAREIVDSIGGIIWAINPKNDRLDNLAGYMREYATEYFEATPIECRFEFPDDVPGCPIAAEVRRNIFLTMKEAINNVVKHSGATAVRMSLKLSGRQVELHIEDNGKGFRTDKVSQYGNGLANMRKRIENISGRFDVRSRPGAGTGIHVIVPLAEGIPLS